MTSAATPRKPARLLALAVLAYVLAFNGMLGAIGAGAHVTEARTAAQLGVICTIHGIGNGPDGGTEDPTPGKLACVEHCVLAVANAMPGAPVSSAIAGQPARVAETTSLPAVKAAYHVKPASAPPPPRGPPSAI